MDRLPSDFEMEMVSNRAPAGSAAREKLFSSNPFFDWTLAKWGGFVALGLQIPSKKVVFVGFGGMNTFLQGIF